MADLPLLVGDYEIKAPSGTDSLIALWCDNSRKNPSLGGGSQFNDTCVGWEFYIDPDDFVYPNGSSGGAHVRVLEEESYSGYPDDSSSLVPTKIRVLDGGDPKPPYSDNIMKAGGMVNVGFLLADESIWPQGYPPADLSNVTFVVQRGADHFSCLGSELGATLQDDDLLLAQRGDTHGSIVKDNIQDDDLFIVTDGDNGYKSVTGVQVKGNL